MEKNKKIIIAVIISIILVMIVGVTYALWSYFRVGPNQQLVAGDIYMKYTETENTINIENAMPTSSYGEDYFEFTIEGKNTYTKPIWYEIIISHGEDHETRKTRIPDEFLRFRLTEQLPGGEETEVIENGKYSDFSSGKRIWVNTIGASQTDEIKITYKLYMWISNKMVIGAGDSASSADMDIDTWNNDAYASVKVTVNGDFQEKQLPNILGTKALKEKIGKEGELIAITEDNKPTTDINESNIREYRYSGTDVNNYVYFNCKDNREPNKKNCDMWRIVGVFKDEGGNELIKIVRTNNLASVPEKYKIGNDWYDLKLNASIDTVYWNKSTNWSKKAHNNWAESGLMYYLNTEKDSVGTKGYLSTLSENAKNMIESTKYYLGTVAYKYVDDSDKGIIDTPITSYKNERMVDGCEDNKGPISNNNGSAIIENSSCRVWANNAATWTGKVALLYPSDFGFTSDSSYWNTKMDKSFTGLSSWLSFSSWLISPTSDDYEFSASFIDSSPTGSYLMSGMTYAYTNAMPTLYLNPHTLIVDGEGTLKSPYVLEYNNTNLVLTEKNDIIEIGNNVKFKVVANTEGTFEVISEKENIVTANIESVQGQEAIINVNGVDEGTANLNVIFIPKDKKYHESHLSFSVTVVKTFKATEMIKNKIGSDGLVGVTNDNQKVVTNTSNIREYRYSGTNVNNFVTFNNELWRIVGVFKDEDNKEHLKIVRNEVLSGIFPETYTIDDVTYNIKGNSEDTASMLAISYQGNLSGIESDWTVSSLQYFLNTEHDDNGVPGYLSKINETYKNMIEDDTKYYLGTVSFTDKEGQYGVLDTIIQAYQNERDINSCVDNIGQGVKEEGCKVHKNNRAYWVGKIGLLYPSDYGFTHESEYWTTLFKGKNSSWLNNANHIKSEWFISNVSSYSWYFGVFKASGDGLEHWWGNYEAGYTVRPTLYLKSDIRITSGNGTSERPYFLEI